MYRLPFSEAAITHAIYTNMVKNFIFPRMEKEEDKFYNKVVHRTLLETSQELSRWLDGPPNTLDLIPLYSLFLEVKKKDKFFGTFGHVT
jgi:hypothetical protein